MKKPQTTAPSSKWAVFGAVAPGIFVTLLDEIGVNQALPPIADRFDATIPEVQWIVLGFLLTVGALLLPIGRFSDMAGRRRVFVVGLAVFTAGAVLAGLAPTLVALILFRVLQGLGVAMVQATSLPIIANAFPTRERGKAIGLFMGVLAFGAICGPLVGGGVVALLGWRFFFFLAVPIGVVSTALALKVLVLRPPSAASDRPDPITGQFDWLGAGLATGALTLFLLVVSFGNQLGWSSGSTLAGFAVVGAMVMAFVKWESKAKAPMLPLNLFRKPAFLIGQLVMFLTATGNTSIFFLVPFYVQDVVGKSPAMSGLVVAALPAAFITTGPAIGALSDRWSWRLFVPVGMALACTATVLLSLVTENSPMAHVMGSLALLGFAMGFVFSPAQNAVYGSIEVGQQGIVTAFVNMARNAGQLSSVAVGAAIVTATMAARGYEPSLDALRELANIGVQGAFVEGMSRAFMVGAGVIFLGLLVSLAPIGRWHKATLVAQAGRGARR